jgi:hypothetical protein
VERHNDSTDSIRDCIESVSDASQYVTDGGGVHDLPFPDYFHVSRSSSPLLDDEDGINTSITPYSQTTGFIEIMSGSMSSQLSSLSPPPRLCDAGVIQPVAPLLMPNGDFQCPKCPRKFRKFIKARYGIHFPIIKEKSSRLTRLT